MGFTRYTTSTTLRSYAMLSYLSYLTVCGGGAFCHYLPPCRALSLRFLAFRCFLTFTMKERLFPPQLVRSAPVPGSFPEVPRHFNLAQISAAVPEQRATGRAQHFPLRRRFPLHRRGSMRMLSVLLVSASAAQVRSRAIAKRTQHHPKALPYVPMSKRQLPGPETSRVLLVAGF